MNKMIQIGQKLLCKGKVERAFSCYAKVSGRDPEIFKAMAKCYEDGLGVDADEAMARKYARMARRATKRRKEMRRRDARLMHKVSREGKTCFTRIPSKERIISTRLEACVVRIKGYIDARRVRRDQRNLDQYGKYVARDVLAEFAGDILTEGCDWVNALAHTL